MLIALLALAIKASPIAPRLALVIGILLGAQIAISVGNVLFGLPLPLADVHTAVAALVLLAVIPLIHHLNYPLTPSTGQASKGVLT